MKVTKVNERRFESRSSVLRHPERIRDMSVEPLSWRGDLFALVVSGPSFRFTEEKVQQVVGELKECAAELTAQLGGHQSIPNWSSKRTFNDR